MVRTKVFVGNLSFKTKEPELSAEFSAAGKVIGANIITRGPRSLGYGFVEMESEEAANKAIQLLHHKEIDGREINVEIVKERPEGEEKADRPPREPRKPREPREPKEPREPREPKQPREPREPRQPREPKEPRAPRNTDNQSSPSGEGPKKTRTRVYKKREDSEGGSSEPRQPREPREPRQPREPSERKPREPREPRAPKPEGEKQEKKPRPKRSNAEKTESPTLLFVANLPFTLDNDTFTKFVTDLSLPFKEAYVVKKHNNRSKGYGFIDFNSTEERASALTKLEGKEIDSRPISVKIALTPSAADSKDANETQEVKSPVKTEKKTEAPKSPAVKDSKPASSPKPAPSPKADAKKDEEPKK